MNRLLVAMIASILIAGIAYHYWSSYDPCGQLSACEQFQCRSPQFYCASTLYDSEGTANSLDDARSIALEYVSKELHTSAEVIFVAQGAGSDPWFEVTVRFGDGGTSALNIGPDGKIYRIDHLN